MKNLDFGPCFMILDGIGYVNGECRDDIGGCDWTIDGIDYTVTKVKVPKHTYQPAIRPGIHNNNKQYHYYYYYNIIKIKSYFTIYTI